jgi:hypothetical protein
MSDDRLSAVEILNREPHPSIVLAEFSRENATDPGIARPEQVNQALNRSGLPNLRRPLKQDP